MSYQDPYYAPQHRNYNAQQPYTDAEYDPYNTRQQHPTYDQSGYNDDEGYAHASPPGGVDGLGHSREKSRYEDTFPPVLRPPKSTGAMRLWRKEQHNDLWTRGGRGKCILRFCCCSILIFLFLVISIVLSLGIWIRPPDITINQVGLNTTGGSSFTVTSSSLSLNLGVNISVDNPNYFNVAFNDIKFDLTYPINNLDLGGGEKDNIVFHSHTQTTFDFPFTLDYKLADDTNQTVLKDLLSKCGITGTKQDITVDYKLTLGLKILFVTVSPSFSNTFNFECPLTKDELSSLLSGSGLDLSGITG